MNSKIFTALAGAGALALIMPWSTSADAKIRCQGPYQINSVIGGKIATPYCEDNYLAAVARAHGMRVSGRAVRQNPHVKEDTCRLVGYDIRVQHICAGYIYDGHARYH